MFGSLASYLRQHHVGVLALFIALSGTAYAATLPRNSVGPAQLKKNAVTSAKIKKNAVTGAKVKSGSLTGLDINESALGKVPSATAADRATTADRAATAGVASSLEKGDVNQATATNPLNTVSTLSATCDPGLKAISAAVQVQNPDTQYIVDLYPTALDTWTTRVSNGGGGGNFTIFVICGAVNSVSF
jgi:hypothetical protein